MPTQTLPIPTDAGARDALLERVRTLAALRHPCVEPVVAVDVRDDGTLAVRRGGAATDLPTVLAVRGRLTSSEAAGVLAAVARGLAALHSAGLRQGGLGAGDVVLGPGGDAMLRPRALAEGGAADGADGEAADVHALAALVGELLGDRADDAATALRAVLAPAAAPDPRVRPEAGTLAAQADAAVPPDPVRLPEPAALAGAALGLRRAAPVPAAAAVRRRAVRGPGGGRAGGEARSRSRSTRSTRSARSSARPALRRSRSWRVLGVAGAVGLAAVLTAVVVQVRLPADPAGPARPTGAATAVVAGAGEAPDPTQDRADPAAAAAELTRRRVALLSGGASGPDGFPDPADLAGLDVPGSPAHEADAALLDDIGQAGTRVRGAEAHLDDVRTQRHEGDEADVMVRYAVGAHEQVAPDGVVTAVPAADARSATLRLAWTTDGWRVAEVS